jgi:hypothetical protein
VLSFSYPLRFLFASKPDAIARRVCQHPARKGWLEGEDESAFLSDCAGRDDGLDGAGFTLWARYLKDWTFWNHVRTIACMAA